ncbi:MAG: DUF4339 domain-containing protein [Planctomycetaceae bacterium]|jgi:flagellar biosynthesis GTPase FlhF|nr:DUF4339 domain-containing protein [Planctomycetaceae bacterium]
MPYFIRYQGRKQGPLSDAQLVTLLARGTISKDTEASLDEKNWQPLGTLPDFDNLYSKIVTQQLKTVTGSSSPAPSPIYETKKSEDDIFAIAGFSHDELTARVDTIQRQMPVTPPITIPEKQKQISGVFENPKILYGVCGGFIGLILLFALLVIIMFGNASPQDYETRLAQEQQQKEAEERAAAEKARREAEVKAATEKAERERQEAEAKAAAEKIERERQEAEAKAAAEKAEQERQEAEAKAAEEKQQNDEAINAELVKVIELLNEDFPLKPMFLGASGTVQCPKNINPKFANLWSLKDKFSLRYISYIPNSIFSNQNVSPHEIVIAYQNEDIFRFFLDEQGLQGQWLDSSSIVPESFRKLNGIAIGELEIVQISNDRSIKSISLFSPAEYETFRPLQKQVTLPSLDCDFNALGLSDSQLAIIDAKGYRTRYAWETLAPDVLKFQVENNDTVQIKLVPKNMVAGNKNEWNIPIEVNEIKRDSPLLQRYIAGTKISPDKVDAKVKEGTEVVNRARSDMLAVRRQFGRNNSNANKAARAIGILNRQLSVANSAGAASIRSQISHQESIISKCRSANSRLEPQLNKLEDVYDNYYRKLKVFKEYKALFDKAEIIYRGEPMTFAIMITHPENPKRYLKLLSIKEPDMANEKDAVIPEPIDNDEKIDKEEEMEDDEENDDQE